MLSIKKTSAFLFFALASLFCLQKSHTNDSHPGITVKAEEEETSQETKPNIILNKKFVVPFDFTRIVKAVTDSVVSIIAVQSQPNGEDEMGQLSKKFNGTPFEEFFRNFSGREGTQRKVHVAGSGFFVKIDKDCVYVATNNHIVENTVRIKILLSDKTEIPASVHGVDPRTDLAVLRIEMKDIPEEKRQMIVPLEWGDSSQLEVGQWVIAIGNPFGLGNTVTHGIISAKGRELNVGGVALTDDYIQHSAQINVGNSGGCLVDTNNYVIGINTIIVTPSGGNVGIGFAIPSNNACKIIEQLILNKKVQHGALGISVQDFTQEMAEGLGIKGYKHGAIVARIEPNSPASKAGIKNGDVIVKFDDVEITGKTKLSRAVGDASINTVHEISLLREEKELKIKVTLGDFDKINGIKSNTKSIEDKPIEILGMMLADSQQESLSQNDPAEKDQRESGAFVVKVTPDSVADEIGLVRGDIITEVNQKPVKSAKDFYDYIVKASQEKKRYVFLRVKHNDFDRFLSLRIDEDEELKNISENKKTFFAPKKDEHHQTSQHLEEDSFTEKFKRGLSHFKNIIEGFFNKRESNGFYH